MTTEPTMSISQADAESILDAMEHAEGEGLWDQNYHLVARIYGAFPGLEIRPALQPRQITEPTLDAMTIHWSLEGERAGFRSVRIVYTATGAAGERLRAARWFPDGDPETIGKARAGVTTHFVIVTSSGRIYFQTSDHRRYLSALTEPAPGSLMTDMDGKLIP